MKIINNEFESILKTLKDALKAFENPHIKLLSEAAVAITRGHVASLIANNYVNIHLKEFVTIVDLKYSSFLIS